jgi:WD40 repeat protein
VSGGIGDFATDLLFRLKYSENTTERLGEVPIVIVTHSMGGLVFKKAFVQGHLNPEYSEIISMIKAVLFLATPHRGTDLATLLHRLLSTSILGHSPKKYVTELARKSPTIDELNESFRHLSSKLQIFSFYETLATVIGPTSVTIVDKATAVMGYPEEIQIPLVANHHDVCKFSNAKDANYISVIGALRSIASSIASGLIASTSNLSAPAPVEKLQYLTDLLRVAGPPEEDISVMYSARKQGLCDTLWSTKEMSRWLSSETPQILWIHAPPGSGKSTLCSLVINRLLETGHRCCYFFFKYGQRDKRSANAMLRSIAYQTALHVPKFRRALVDIAKLGVKLQTADPAAIWDKLFSTKLDKAGMEDNIYWVLDGLDEADSSKRVVELMSRVKDFGSCVRILIFGRPLPNITQEFQVAKKRIEIQNLPLPNNQNDIYSMVAEQIDHLLSNDSFKAEIVNEVVTRSQGNFLWASLVAQNLAKFRREDQIRRLLDFTPDGMHELYDRMTDTILDLPLAEDKALARVLLIWAMYAINPPTVEELTEAYPVEFEGVLDLNHTITYVCGQFVVVNSQRQVSLVHHSAREYLEKAERRPYALDAQHAHEECFQRCITTLCDSSLKRKLRMLQPPQFLPYAATSWPSHLRGCPSDSEQVLDILVRFLSGPQPLAWIQYLAMSNGLSELLSASRELTAYTRRRKTANRHKPPGKRRLSDLSLIASWATDLMKVPSKFGFYLTEKPSMVYQCLPTLCPTSSIMHQKFNQNPASTLAVSGLSSYTQWDDRLARVSGGPGQAHHLARSALYLAMANNDPIGTVTVWDTTLFDELKVFSIGEYVAALAFNNSGSLLACYSSSKTFVWDVTDWSLQMSAENPRLDHILEFRFDEDDTLMMVTEFRRLHKLVAGETQALPAWEKQDPDLLGEPLARPCCVTFNSNCTQIAISYSHFPVSIWSVEPPEMVARLKNSPSHERRPMVSYTGKSKVVWHPSGVHVICIYGKAFKWNFDTDLYQEVEDKNETPHDLACSPDGRTFITMNAKGLIQIYDFSSMALTYSLSTEGMSNRLCFSLDGLQIYHLTRSYCNIWEPKCLLTLADEVSGQVQGGDADAGNFLYETGDDHSTPISVAAPETSGSMEGRPDILDVAPGPAYKGLLVGYTNRDGSVNIYDAISNRKYEICKIDFAIKIDRLAWSPKYDRLAYSMINGGTAVVAISTSVGPRGVRSVSTEAVYTDKDWNTDRGRTHRIVFHSTDSRLLISGRDRCQVLALPQGDVLGEIQHPNHFDCLEWQRHPSEPEHLLRFTSSSITIFSWGGLEEKASIPLDLTKPTPGTDDGDQPPVELDAILDNYCRQYLLLRTFTMVRNSPRYSFAILPSKEVYSRTAAHLIPESAVQPESPTQFKPVNLPPSIKPIPVPESLTSIVTHPLGILRDGLLVFLDWQLWLCTTTLPYPTAPTDGPGSAEKDKQEFKPDVKRYFFIPQDWVTEEGLRMCRVLEDGTVLCPSKGEVAILKGGLVEDSWV